MKITGRCLLLTGVLLLVVVSGCSWSSNVDAKRLHAEASQVINECLENTRSYTETWVAYREAGHRIERILADDPSGKVARGLLSGDLLIARLTLDQFRKLEDSLEDLVGAEQCPLACALLLARTVAQPTVKASALCEIAGLYAERGQGKMAIPLLSEALECVSKLESPEQQSRGMVEIAVVYADIGQAKKASQILSRVLDATSPPTHADREKNRFLAMMAVSCADAGDFNLAHRALRIVRVGDERSAAMNELSAKAANAGNYEYAAELIDELMAPVKAIQHPEHRPLHESVALTKTAAAYVDAGLKDRALQILSQAHEAAMAIERTETLVEIADFYVTLEEPQKASELLIQCLKLEIDSGASYENAKLGRATVFAEMAQVCMRMGRQEDALKLLSLALDLVETVEHPWSRSYGLREIAGVYASIGERDKVLQLLSQALVSAKAIPTPLDESDRDSALNQIAELYAETGEIGQALDVAMLMKDEFFFCMAMSDVVDACTTADALRQVQERFMAKGFEDKDWEAWVLGDFAIRHAKLGEFGQAFHTLQALDAESDRSWVMGRIAVEIAKSNPRGQSRLVKLTQTIRPLDQFWQSSGSR